MKVELSPDWTEFLSALIARRVRFVLVGGHAVAGPLCDRRSNNGGSQFGISLAASLGALRALEDAPWIAWDASLGHLPDARWVDKHVGGGAVVLRTNSVGALLAAAERGVGVLLLSRVLARARELSEVTLTKRLRASLSPTPRTSLWLVGHRALRRVPRIAAVWSFVIEEAKRRGM